jgi:hypothetical protein
MMFDLTTFLTCEHSSNMADKYPPPPPSDEVAIPMAFPADPADQSPQFLCFAPYARVVDASGGVKDAAKKFPVAVRKDKRTGRVIISRQGPKATINSAKNKLKKSVNKVERIKTIISFFQILGKWGVLYIFCLGMVTGWCVKFQTERNDYNNARVELYANLSSSCLKEYTKPIDVVNVTTVSKSYNYPNDCSRLKKFIDTNVEDLLDVPAGKPSIFTMVSILGFCCIMQGVFVFISSMYDSNYRDELLRLHGMIQSAGKQVAFVIDTIFVEDKYYVGIAGICIGILGCFIGVIVINNGHPAYGISVAVVGTIIVQLGFEDIVKGSRGLLLSIASINAFHMTQIENILKKHDEGPPAEAKDEGDDDEPSTGHLSVSEVTRIKSGVIAAIAEINTDMTDIRDILDRYMKMFD